MTCDAVVFVLHNVTCLTKICTPVWYILSIEPFRFSVKKVMEKREVVVLVHLLVFLSVNVVINVFSEMFSMLSSRLLLNFESKSNVVGNLGFRLGSLRVRCLRRMNVLMNASGGPPTLRLAALTMFSEALVNEFYIFFLQVEHFFQPPLDSIGSRVSLVLYTFCT